VVSCSPDFFAESWWFFGGQKTQTSLDTLTDGRIPSTAQFFEVLSPESFKPWKLSHLDVAICGVPVNSWVEYGVVDGAEQATRIFLLNLGVAITSALGFVLSCAVSRSSFGDSCGSCERDTFYINLQVWTCYEAWTHVWRFFLSWHRPCLFPPFPPTPVHPTFRHTIFLRQALLNVNERQGKSLGLVFLALLGASYGNVTVEELVSSASGKESSTSHPLLFVQGK